MKVEVNKDICLGCGACQGIAPNVFTINDEGVAEAINPVVPEEEVENAKDAVEGCPVSAIDAQ